LIKFVPASYALVREFYGKPPQFSMRGLVTLLNDKPVALMGVYMFNNQMIAFSEIKDELRPFKKAIARGVRLMMYFLHSLDFDIYAVASDKEMTAPKLLRKLGFEKTGELPNGQETFVLRK
jgi:hypothetical protein